MVRTQANLIHDGDTGVLGLLVQLHHGRGYIARGNYVLLLADGGLDDCGMEGIGDQADNQVVLANLSIQCLVVGHIEGNGGGMLNTLGERLGGREGSASFERGQLNDSSF